MIRSKKYTTAQLEILMRDENQAVGDSKLPQLQIFVNTAVRYALSIIQKDAEEDLLTIDLS